jgi:hypothetical protein
MYFEVMLRGALLSLEVMTALMERFTSSLDLVQARLHR